MPTLRVAGQRFHMALSDTYIYTSTYINMDIQTLAISLLEQLEEESQHF